MKYHCLFSKPVDCLDSFAFLGPLFPSLPLIAALVHLDKHRYRSRTRSRYGYDLKVGHLQGHPEYGEAMDLSRATLASSLGPTTIVC